MNKKILKKPLTCFLKNWYWFVLFLGLGGVGAILFLKKSTAYYGSTASILIKPQKSAFKALENNSLALNSEARDEVTNEMKIMGSRKMINEAIQKLNIDISYFVQG